MCPSQLYGNMEFFSRFVLRQCIIFIVQEQGTKFLFRKILGNIDAGRPFDCIFSDMHASTVFLSSVIVFGFEYCTVKFPLFLLLYNQE